MAVALVLDRFAVDGEVYDVLEDCDQLSQVLGRLRRQGRISEQDWIASKEQVAEIRVRIEAHLTL
jgi:hypothetical protein